MKASENHEIIKYYFIFPQTSNDYSDYDISIEYDWRLQHKYHSQYDFVV